MASPSLRAARSLTAPLTSSIRPRKLPVRPRKVPRRRATTQSTSEASSTTTTSTPPPPPPPPPPASGPSPVRPILYASLAAFIGAGAYLYFTDTRAAAHRFVVPRLIRVFFPDAEDAHEFGTQVMKALHMLNLHPRERMPWPSPFADSDEQSQAGGVKVWDMELDNPIGISAGLDKNAEIPDALFALGAAVVEVGGCTPLPQQGNPRPRVFRIPALDAMINRYGLNSKGADVMAIQLRSRVRKFARENGYTESEVLNGEAGVPPGALLPGRMLAVQIAKNKDTNERDITAVARDYIYCVRRLAPYADVLVVNVSSPNTPGLRDLQAVEPLTRILAAVVREAQATDRKDKPRVMVKVSPDEDETAQINGIVQAVWMSGVDGVIVGNTTKRRPPVLPGRMKLTPQERETLSETGGFSGPQMIARTCDLVSRYRHSLDSVLLKSEGSEDEIKGRDHPDRKVIFATGGITTGEDANMVRRLGADVAMVYTGLVYGGAGTITRIKSEMQRNNYWRAGSRSMIKDEKAKTITEKVRGAIDSSKGAVEEAKKKAEDVPPKVEEAVEKAKKKVKHVPPKAEEVVEETKDKVAEISDESAKAVEAAKEKATEAAAETGQAVETTKDKAAGLADGLGKAAQSAKEEAVDAVKALKKGNAP